MIMGIKVTFMGKETTTDELYKAGLYGQWLGCCVEKSRKKYSLAVDEVLKGASTDEAMAVHVPFNDGIIR
jgi:hypothetical protein